MKRAVFNAVVTRLEGEALADPQKYRGRVLGLAMPGYAYEFRRPAFIAKRGA